MYGINIQVSGIKESIERLEKVVAGVNYITSEVGDETVEYMRNVIKNSARRGSLGTLGKSINVESGDTGTIHWVGVGRKSQLAPYWSVVNYGGYSPPTTGKYVPLGAFPDGAPVAGKTGGTWNVGAGNYTFLDDKYPKQEIRPMNYIEITMGRMVNVLRSKLLSGDVSRYGTQMFRI